jgi:hypothetical protein
MLPSHSFHFIEQGFNALEGVLVIDEFLDIGLLAGAQLGL